MINWPTYSPDLNLIKWVWNKMKNWIQDNYPHDNMSYNQLRDVVREAWEAITEDYLQSLIITMPDRIQAVIAANGQYIKA